MIASAPVTARATDALVLSATDYAGPTRWRWILTTPTGGLLADHEVRLDPQAVAYEGFLDLEDYLWRHAAPDRRRPDEQRLLAQVGAWIGEHVLGAAGTAI